MRRGARVGIVVGGVALMLAIGILAAVSAGVFQEPVVKDIQNEWGTITDAESEIITTVVVENPNPIGLPIGELDINYVVTMNEIGMGEGGHSGVNPDPGINVFELVTAIDNRKIPDWWVSHINNGEHTELRIDPTLTLNLIGSFTFDVPGETRVIDTDLLAQVDSDEPEEVTASGQPLLIIHETRGAWGTASRTVTPLILTVMIENPNPIPLIFTEITYRIEMNEIVVGEGSTSEPIEIPPQTTETVETSAAIDTGKLDDWWVSHLQNDETTSLHVEFTAMVETPGEEISVPLTNTTETIETDILGE